MTKEHGIVVERLLSEWVFERDLVLLDGRLYFTTLGVEKYRPRGAYCAVEINRGAGANFKVRFMRNGHVDEYFWDTIVHTIHDVGTIHGPDKGAAVNHIQRWMYPRECAMLKFADTRRQNFVLDYRIIKDTHGIKDKNGYVKIPAGLQRVTVEEIKELNFPGSDNFMFIPANKIESESGSDSSITVKANDSIWLAGTNIGFTDRHLLAATKEYFV